MYVPCPLYIHFGIVEWPRRPGSYTILPVFTYMYIACILSFISA